MGIDLREPPPAGLADVVDLWCPGDVTLAAEMHRAMEATVAALGRIDVVVANAGVTALGSFDDTSDEAFVRVMDVNLHGAVRTLRAAVEHLRATGGRVVVMSSVAGFAPVLGRPAYVASKHAVTGLFESLRPELARDGVGVTLVHPGFLATSPADADRVAREVARGVRRGDARILVGRTARLAHLVHRIAPALYVRQMVRRLSGS